MEAFGPYYSTSAAVIVVSVLFPVLGVIFVSLRFYTRTKAKVALWIDDWLTLPALLLEFVFAGLLIWGAATNSLGKHLPLPPADLGPTGYLFFESPEQVRVQQIQYIVDILGVFAFGFLKLSMLFFYRKIFVSKATQTIFDIATVFMIVLVTVWMFSFGIGAIFLCGGQPHFAWSAVALEATHCKAQLPFLEAYAITDFIMDVLIWTMPIPKIWSLHMTVSHKLSVVAVFLVGALTIAASGARMSIYIIFIVNAFNQADGEKILTYLLFWTMVELGLAVVVVCLPTLRGPMRTLWTKMSPGSILSGIRDVFTNRSLKSDATNRSQTGVYRLDSMDRNSGKSSTSQPKIYLPNEGALQTSIVGNSSPETFGKSMESGIHVHNEVLREEV